MEIIKNGLVEAYERVSAVVDGYEITATVYYTPEGVKEIKNGAVVKDQNQVANFQRWSNGSKTIGYTVPDEEEQDYIHVMLKEFFAGIDSMYNVEAE